MRLGRKLAAGIVTETVPESIETDELERAEVRVEDAPQEQPVELIEQTAGR